jgi:hypothetical protein
MIKNVIKSVVAAGLFAAALASTSNASAQEYYPAPRSALSTETLQWQAGAISATLVTGLTEATLSTVVPPFLSIGHSLDIQMYCAHGNYVSNGEAYSIHDQSDTIECDGNNVIQKVDATVIVGN